LELTVQKLILWTDATTVIHWLNSSTVQPPFIEARIKEICQPLDVTTPVMERDFLVRHVPGETNPADLATRGTKANKSGELVQHSIMVERSSMASLPTALAFTSSRCSKLL